MRTKFSLLLLALFGLTVASCSHVAIETSTEGRNQSCPAWANYPGGACDIKIWKDGVIVYIDVNMDDWTKVRITSLFGELIVDNGQNITVRRDNGVVVDFQKERLAPGSYIFEKVDKTAKGGLRINNPHGNLVVHVSAEFVRPAQ